MRSANSIGTTSPADIIELGKLRRQAGQSESGSVSQPATRGHALTLPEDVVTLSFQQSETKAPPIPKKASQPVTLTEKQALLGSDTPPYRLSIYG